MPKRSETDDGAERRSQVRRGTLSAPKRCPRGEGAEPGSAGSAKARAPRPQAAEAQSPLSATTARSSFVPEPEVQAAPRSLSFYPKSFSGVPTAGKGEPTAGTYFGH